MTRSRPAQSIDILRETWSTYLDPSLNPPEIRPWGSKCLINACMEYRYIKQFAKRLKLAQPVYEKVAMRWAELGFPGPVPAVHSFEFKRHADGSLRRVSGFAARETRDLLAHRRGSSLRARGRRCHSAAQAITWSGNGARRSISHPPMPGHRARLETMGIGDRA